MTIPLYSLLFVYIIFMTVFAVFLLVNLYHILMTGSVTIVSFFVSFFVFFSTFLILYLTWYLLQGTDWQQTLVNFSGLSGLFNSPNF